MRRVLPSDAAEVRYTWKNVRVTAREICFVDGFWVPGLILLVSCAETFPCVCNWDRRMPLPKICDKLRCEVRHDGEILWEQTSVV